MAAASVQLYGQQRPRECRPETPSWQSYSSNPLQPLVSMKVKLSMVYVAG